MLTVFEKDSLNYDYKFENGQNQLKMVEINQKWLKSIKNDEINQKS